jgi:chromosome segregation ATPase
MAKDDPYKLEQNLSEMTIDTRFSLEKELQNDMGDFINRTQQQFFIPKKSEDLNATRTPAVPVTRFNESRRTGFLTPAANVKANPTARASDVGSGDDGGVDEEDLLDKVRALLAQLEALLREAIFLGLETLKAALEASIEALQQALEASIEALQQALDTLSESLNSLAELVYRLETDLQMLSQDIIAATKEIAKLTAKITQLETENNQLASRVSALEQRLDAASIDAECYEGSVTVTLNI